jgi:purine-binding chemotaxis protein CheW
LPATGTGAGMSSFVVFAVDGLSLALPLNSVSKTTRAVAVTPLIHAPNIVRGVVDVQGTIVPVVDLRRRFGLAEREIGLADQLLFARSAQRVLAMVVDAVVGVIECDETAFVAVDTIVAGTRHLKGIVRGADGMVLIQDLDSFLSLEEESGLDAALAAAPAG